MPRWLRWITYGVLGLVAIVGAVLLLVYLTTSLRFRRTYTIASSPVVAAADSASLARGRHLVEAIGKCAECHGADLGGKLIVDSPVFGRLAGSNLTAGTGGIAGASDADLERAIRHGVGRDGRALFFMPAEAFHALTDEDLAALLGYVRSLPPVDRETPAPRVGPIARLLYLGGKFPLLPVELVDHGARPSAPAPGVTAEYGEYLATTGGCRSCHGMALAGDANPDAPNITRGRLGSWSEADFFRALREGRRPDGTAIDAEKMPWVRSGRMTDDETKAVWMYMRSVPPVKPEG